MSSMTRIVDPVTYFFCAQNISMIYRITRSKMLTVIFYQLTYFDMTLAIKSRILLMIAGYKKLTHQFW